MTINEYVELPKEEIEQFENVAVLDNRSDLNQDAIDGLEQHVKDLQKDFEKNIIYNSKNEGNDRAEESVKYIKWLVGAIVGLLMLKAIKRG